MRLALVGGDVEDPIDTPVLLRTLGESGLRPDAVSWRDPAARWADYDVVLLRSCWDYVHDVEAFLDWARRVAGVSRLINPVELVTWNADKRYLVELARAGVPVVPSIAVAPGEPFAWPGDLAPGELVVKPAVGAGSRQVARYAPADRDRAARHVAALHAGGHTVLLQPYIGSVDQSGERAVYVIDGHATHMVIKSPVLVPGAEPPGGFELARIQRAEAHPLEPAAAAFAERAVRGLPGGVPLYARVDTVEGPGGPLLLELELIEPVLFLDRVGHAAGALVAGLLRRARDGRPDASGSDTEVCS